MVWSQAIGWQWCPWGGVGGGIVRIYIKMSSFQKLWRLVGDIYDMGRVLYGIGAKIWDDSYLESSTSVTSGLGLGQGQEPSSITWGLFFFLQNKQYLEGVKHSRLRDNKRVINIVESEIWEGCYFKSLLLHWMCTKAGKGMGEGTLTANPFQFHFLFSPPPSQA